MVISAPGLSAISVASVQRQKCNITGERALPVRMCPAPSISPVVIQSTFCEPPDTMEKEIDGFREPSSSAQWHLDSEKLEVERQCKISLILLLFYDFTELVPT